MFYISCPLYKFPHILHLGEASCLQQGDTAKTIVEKNSNQDPAASETTISRPENTASTSHAEGLSHLYLP